MLGKVSVFQKVIPNNTYNKCWKNISLNGCRIHNLIAFRDLGRLFSLKIALKESVAIVKGSDNGENDK